MNRSLLICALTVASCTPAESVAPEHSTERSFAALGPVETRLVPLSSSSPDWIVPSPYAIVRHVLPCGEPAPDIAVWTMDIDDDSLPHGASIVSLNLAVDPCDSGRGSFLPDNPPMFAINFVNVEGKIEIASGGVQDQSADVASYVKPHSIEWNAPPLPPIDRSRWRAVVLLENEYGADAVGGFRVLGLRIAYTL